MQDRYVGDFGDYVKLAILRALSQERRLGIAWWKFPDEIPNADGRHLSYLDRPGEWQKYDPRLFDDLCAIRRRGQRNIRHLENLLPEASFASELIPSRPAERQRWFQQVIEQLEPANLVFADPDNGIAADSFRPTRRKSGKSISFAEISGLARSGRPLVIYHHQTRRVGGHCAELQYLAKRLKEETTLLVSGALRARPWSPRAFFILNADARLIEKAEQIAQIWKPHVTWHANLLRDDGSHHSDIACGMLC